MLILTRKPNQAIMIGNNIRVVVVGLDSEEVRLGIEAPQNVPIRRYEIFQEVNRANKSVLRTVGKGSTEGDTSG